MGYSAGRALKSREFVHHAGEGKSRDLYEDIIKEPCHNGQKQEKDCLFHGGQALNVFIRLHTGEYTKTSLVSKMYHYDKI